MPSLRLLRPMILPALMILLAACGNKGDLVRVKAPTDAPVPTPATEPEPGAR